MKPTAILLVIIMLGAGVLSAQTNQPGATNMDKDVIAVVLGKKITINDKDKLNGLIFSALLEQFAEDNKIEPTEQELDAFVLKIDERKRQHQIKFEQDRQKLLAELKSSLLSDRERKEKESQLQTIENILKNTRKLEERTKGKDEQLHSINREIAQQFVRKWKINKVLYAKYGGRVIFQQAGVEPFDAYRDFLKEQEKKGAFKILDKKYEASFWKYFTNDAMHTFYTKDDGIKFINTPWWMMEKPQEE